MELKWAKNIKSDATLTLADQHRSPHPRSFHPWRTRRVPSWRTYVSFCCRVCRQGGNWDEIQTQGVRLCRGEGGGENGDPLTSGGETNKSEWRNDWKGMEENGSEMRWDCELRSLSFLSLPLCVSIVTSLLLLISLRSHTSQQFHFTPLLPFSHNLQQLQHNGALYPSLLLPLNP